MEAQWIASYHDAQWGQQLSTPQLGIVADLTLENGHDQIVVRGDGANLIVEVADASSAFRLVRCIWSAGIPRNRVDSVIKLLRQVGISITIRTRTRRLMTIAGEKDSMLLRLLGLRGIGLHRS